MKDNTKVFEEYTVPKAVMTMALPSMLSMLINIVYNLADTFFVGQTGDSNQVAAVSVSMPLFLLFIAMGNLFGVGGCAFVSRSLGEGKKDRVKTISAFCIYTSIIVGAVLGIIFFSFKNQILMLVGASENTVGLAADYLKWVALGAPSIVLAITTTNLVRGEGAAKESMIGSVIGQIANIILDPIFILDKGDKLFGITMPFGFDMGVAGAAIATVIGNILTVIYFLVYFLRGKSILSITPKRFSMGNGIVKGVIGVGLPAAVNNLLMSVSNIIVNVVLIKYGDNAVAAMGIAMKANMLVVMLQIGLAQGVQPLIGYCYGAQNYKRMKKCMRFSIICNVVIGTAMTLFYLFFRRTVIELFINNNDVIELGEKMLLALMASGPVIGIMFVLNFSFQGMGKGIQSMILSLGRQGLIYVPMLFIMNSLIGLEGIIWSQSTADICCVITSIVMFALINKNIKKQEKESVLAK
ncbi:MAG: MATE family efflux transporter [Eubacteriales bacterium]|nr:MATE family efflux transporter [Eubacteriales bacterium]